MTIIHITLSIDTDAFMMAVSKGLRSPAMRKTCIVHLLVPTPDLHHIHHVCLRQEQDLPGRDAW